MDQIGCQFRKAIEPAFRPAIFDRDVAALDIARFRQGLAQGGETAAHQIAWRRAAEKSDHRHRRLLRARCERPRRRRAAEQRDEIAPPHSITSSARPSSCGGTVRPSAFAVLMLRAVTNLVAACTGRSAGLVPRRMRSTQAKLVYPVDRI